MILPGCRWFRTLFLLGVCLGSVGLAGQPADPFGPLADLKPGATQQVGQDVSLTVGHAHLRFSGRWTPLMRGDQAMGLFLEGNGSVTYRSSFEPEAILFERNAKDLGELVAVRDGAARAVTIPFTQARVLLAGTALPLWGGQASGEAGSYAAFTDRWQKVDGYAPDQLLAAQALNAPDRTVAFIEMEGKDHRWLYQYDGLSRREEHLAIVRPIREATGDLKGWHYPVTVSRQYLGWDPRTATEPVPFMVTALDVDLRTADNRQAQVVVQETLLPLEPGQRVLTFELWSSLMEATDTRHLRITKVTDGTGHSLPFSHSHDRLAICFPVALARGVATSIRLEYEGDFLVQPRGDNYWQLGVRASWYPTPASLGAEWYTFHATVRTRGEWLAFLPGETVQRGKDGDWNIVETRTDKPICFATILGGKYFVDEETKDGLTIRIATYGFKPGAVNKVFMAQARNVIRYYETFLGPFPFKEFSIVEKNEWGYGQAPPGMMYITRDAFEQAQNIRQAQEVADLIGQYGKRNVSLQTMDVRHVMAHEIAHQYWGVVLKMPSPEDQWVTESFADYCAALYDRDYKGVGHFKKNVAGWKGDAERSHDKGPIPLANDIHYGGGYESFLARRDLLYAKGPVLLHALHEGLGDQVFLTWLKSSQTNFKWKFASTQRLFDLLRFITKQDQTAFLDRYFWGLELPAEKP